MRNALISTGVTFAVVWVVTSGQARGWLLLLVLVGGMFWALSQPARRNQPAAKGTAKGTNGSPAVSLPVRAAGWAGRLWRGIRAVGRAGRAGAAAGAIPARHAWNLRRLWWKYGPGHRDLVLPCRYCRHRSRTADEALEHADTHLHDYLSEVTPTAPDQDGDRAEREPHNEDPGSADQPGTDPDQPDHSKEQYNMADPTPLGTAGRASLAGLVMDWETSVEARQNWETFVVWLQAQAATATQASVIVPDLVTQFHGRGPTGKAGVPDQIIGRFVAAFVDARTAEANAYKQFAADYAAHVDAAETELTTTYGREVLAAAHNAHH